MERKIANIELSEKSREHMIYRAKKRFKCSVKDPNGYIDNFIRVLEGQSPEIKYDVLTHYN